MAAPGTEPRWAPSRLAASSATVGAVAVVAALLTRRGDLLAAAAPALVVVASALPPVRRTRVSAVLVPDRVAEGEPVTLVVTVRGEGRVGAVDVAPRLPSTLALASADARASLSGVDRTTGGSGRAADVALDSGDGGDDVAARVEVPLVAARWGAGESVVADVRLRSADGLRATSRRLVVAAPRVHPRADAFRDVVVPDHLPRRRGDHVVGSQGAGSELHTLSPWQPGDNPRRVHWPASLRTGQLLVTRFDDERAADVVLVVDALSDVEQGLGGPGAGTGSGERTLDRAVRAALGVARAHLRHHDRVGLVVVGGRLTWLRASSATRQLHHVVDAVLDARTMLGAQAPTLDRLPRPALPPRALCVVLTPLLDPRMPTVVGDLRRRGHPVLVADVLGAEPPANAPLEQLARRLWRLERAATLHELERVGVRVLPASDPTSLSAAVAAMRSRARPSGVAR